MLDPFLRQQLDVRMRGRMRDFAGEHCVLGPTLVVPLFVLWRSYRAYCERLGADADADPKAFRAWLTLAPWARVEEHPRGGLRRTVVHGVGLRSTAPVGVVRT